MRVRLAAAAALLLLLAGCSGDDPGGQAAPEPTPPPTAAPPPPSPATNVCHELTYEQALAPTNASGVTPCPRGHTSQTFAVGTLETVLGGHLVAIDSDAVQRQVARECPSRLGRFLGADAEQIRLTMLRAVWFTPTVEDSDAGANWYRCDVIAVARNGRLATVRGRLNGVLATPEGRDTFGMCGTAAPDAPDFEPVLCREDHTWRAISSVDLTQDLPKGGGYPGETAAQEAGQQPCEDAGRSVADDALDFEWGYEYPTREQWNAGQTFGRCWAPD